MSQGSCVYISHREVVTKSQSCKADTWIDHVEELEGNRELEIVKGISETLVRRLNLDSESMLSPHKIIRTHNNNMYQSQMFNNCK